MKVNDQAFLDYLATYEYIDDEGYLDLENFSCVLSSCFFQDGNSKLSPLPNDVYGLLVILIDRLEESDKKKDFINIQKISPWRSEYENVYPERHITKIHVLGLLLTWHDWIYEVGRTLLEIKPQTESPIYYYWAIPEWTFVNTFIVGFHRAFVGVLKETDKASIVEKGYSNFEALHLSLGEGNNFSDEVTKLIARRSVHQEAIGEIKSAIDAGYYLEAITLQECLISNTLFNYISGRDVKQKNTTLNKLIITVKDLVNDSNIETLDLLDNVNSWRKQRNSAMHGVVTQRIDLYPSSDYRGVKAYGETVEFGIEICLKLQQWYDEEAVNFIKTDFVDPPSH